jgi:methionine-rich copper-binding protein CopC
MRIHPSLIRLVAATLLVGAASSALSHASMIRSSPTANSTVKVTPRQVSIFFSERVKAAPGAIAVQDAKGDKVDLGDAKSDNNGRVVRTSVRLLEAGSYRVDWRVQSRDGHTVQGSFAFQVSP